MEYAINRIFMMIVLSFLIFGIINSAYAYEEEKSKALTATLQIALGTPATIVGIFGGIASMYGLAQLDQSDLIIFVPLIVLPNLASSATVYGIGKMEGYHGSFRATFLSGLIGSTACALTLLSTGLGNGGVPKEVTYLIWGSIILIPVAETIGFYISHSRHVSSRNKDAAPEYKFNLMKIAF